MKKEETVNTADRILVYGMTDNMGGIEAYIMNVYRHLDKDRLTFDFIVDFPEMAYNDEVSAGGSNIYFIPAKGKNPLKHLAEFYRVLKKHKEYKTVYFNILNAGAAFSMLVPFLLRRKIVTHSHNSSDNNMRLHNAFKGLLNFFTKGKLACSQVAADYMFGENSGAVIINNAIELDKYIYNENVRMKKRSELGLDNELTVLHVGRMSPEKNPMYIIDIFSEIVKRQSDAVLLYTGRGPMEDEIKKYAEDKNLTEKNIKFLGMRKDVNELMQAADIFLLPSLFEGLPVVGIEAQTADLQCFLSDKITEAVKITDKVKFLSIEQPAGVWADSILSAEVSGRVNRKQDMTDAGYNIEKEVEKLVKALD